MGKMNWLVINYNLPTEPSRYRVAAWRALKKLGALNIQQSMWVLPYSIDNYSALQRIDQDIEANDGEALIMKSTFFEDKYEERIIALFNNMRNEEYMEYINECDKYLKELKKEISIKKFTFAELEEEEEELHKLISWYKKIKDRDIFNSSEGKLAEERTQQIEKNLKYK
ncbi:chromate resistance protein ChrB [Clostridium bovifaecis]|uniref:Chromate resistance protein ChrB n=1 Tax=Clostridium bovifaecis TaxID=2184719 RepID=A0A6I6F0X3_9CLOT|nr:chromate resistance protein ChrB [Clostridium bovifaecis]